jgi:hypothetical protein
MGVWYCTREAIASAPDIELSARSYSAIDSAIESASRSVEGLLHRRFYPLVATKYWNYPNDQHAGIGRLWFDEHELISLTSFTAGGVTIASTDYFLEPVNDGPPYTHLEIDRASNAVFASNTSTPQRALALTGLWYHNDETTIGPLTEALDTSETGIDGTYLPTVGVGSIIRVDNERMIVIEKQWLTSTQTVQTALTASASNTTVAVTTGSVFQVGEIILVDSERMLVVDVAGNNLTVKRAIQGTVLATHNGSTIYWPRTLTVSRGALGTTAAAHDTATSVAMHVVPALVNELTIAYALNNLLQRAGGYARTVRAADSEGRPQGRGIKDLEEDTYRRYGRKARTVAV